MLNQWICGVLGLLVAVVPFLALSETTLTWTLVVAGSVIAVGNFWGLLSASGENQTQSFGGGI